MERIKRIIARGLVFVAAAIIISGAVLSIDVSAHEGPADRMGSLYTNHIFRVAVAQAIRDCYNYAAKREFTMDQYSIFGTSDYGYSDDEGGYAMRTRYFGDHEGLNQNTSTDNQYNSAGYQNNAYGFSATLYQMDVLPVMWTSRQSLIWNRKYDYSINNTNALIHGGHLEDTDDLPVGAIVSGLTGLEGISYDTSFLVNAANNGFSNGVARLPQVYGVPVDYFSINSGSGEAMASEDTTYFCDTFLSDDNEGIRNSKGHTFYGMLTEKMSGISEVPTREAGELKEIADFLYSMGYTIEPQDKDWKCASFIFYKQRYQIQGDSYWDRMANFGNKTYTKRGDPKTYNTEYICLQVIRDGKNANMVSGEAKTEPFDRYGLGSDEQYPYVSFEPILDENGGFKVHCDSSLGDHTFVHEHKSCDGKVFMRGQNGQKAQMNIEEVGTALGDFFSTQATYKDSTAFGQFLEEAFKTLVSFVVCANPDWMPDYEVYYFVDTHSEEPIPVEMPAIDNGCDQLQSVCYEEGALVDGEVKMMSESPEMAATIATQTIFSIPSSGNTAQLMGSVLNSSYTGLDQGETYALYREYLLNYYDAEMYCLRYDEGAEDNWVQDDSIVSLGDMAKTSSGNGVYSARTEDKKDENGVVIERAIDVLQERINAITDFNPNNIEDEDIVWDVNLLNSDGTIKCVKKKGTSAGSSICDDSLKNSDGTPQSRNFVQLTMINNVDGRFRRCFARPTKNTTLKVYGVNKSTKRFFEAVDLTDIYAELTAPDFKSGGFSSSDIGTQNSSIFGDGLLGSMGKYDGYEVELEYSCYGYRDEEGNYQGTGTMGLLMCPLMDRVGSTVSSLYEKVIKKLLKVDTKVYRMEDDNAVYLAYKNVLSSANIVLAIMFIFVIFSQISGFKINSFGLKAMLPRLIVGALLVNISFLVCSVCLDLCNLLGNIIEDLCDDVIQGTIAAKGANTIPVPNEPSGVATIGKVSLVVVVVGALTAAIIFTHGSVLVSILMSFLSLVVSVIGLFITLLARQAAIILFIAISPMAFACNIFPGTQKYFKMWANGFKGVLVIFPIASAVVYGSQMVSKVMVLNMDSLQNSEISDTYADISYVMSMVSALVICMAPIFILPGLVKRAMSAISNVTGAIGNTIRNRGGSMARRAIGYSGLGRGMAVWNTKSADKAASKNVMNQAKKAEKKLNKMEARDMAKARRQSRKELKRDERLAEKYNGDVAKIEAAKKSKQERARKFRSNPIVRTLGAPIRNLGETIAYNRHTERDRLRNAVSRFEQTAGSATAKYLDVNSSDAMNVFARCLTGKRIDGNGGENAMADGTVRPRKVVSRSQAKQMEVALSAMLSNGDQEVVNGFLAKYLDPANLKAIPTENLRRMAKIMQSSTSSNLAVGLYGYQLANSLDARIAAERANVPESEIPQLTGFRRYCYGSAPTEDGKPAQASQLIKDMRGLSKRVINSQDKDTLSWLGRKDHAFVAGVDANGDVIMRGANESFIDYLSGSQIASLDQHASAKQRKVVDKIIGGLNESKRVEVLQQATTDHVAGMRYVDLVKYGGGSLGSDATATERAVAATAGAALIRQHASHAIDVIQNGNNNYRYVMNSEVREALGIQLDAETITSAPATKTSTGQTSTDATGQVDVADDTSASVIPETSNAQKANSAAGDSGTVLPIINPLAGATAAAGAAAVVGTAGTVDSKTTDKDDDSADTDTANGATIPKSDDDDRFETKDKSRAENFALIAQQSEDEHIALIESLSARDISRLNLEEIDALGGAELVIKHSTGARNELNKGIKNSARQSMSEAARKALGIMSEEEVIAAEKGITAPEDLSDVMKQRSEVAPEDGTMHVSAAISEPDDTRIDLEGWQRVYEGAWTTGSNGKKNEAYGRRVSDAIERWNAMDESKRRRFLETGATDIEGLDGETISLLTSARAFEMREKRESSDGQQPQPQSSDVDPHRQAADKKRKKRKNKK